MTKITNSILLLLSAVFTLSTHAQSYISVEGGALWQSLNDQRIPGDSGTLFSISDFDDGPFPSYRVYVGHLWGGKHELRALYAPLAIEIDGSFNQAVNFQGETFAANTETTAFYKFNSYRMTYAYHFDPLGGWKLALGFTLKVRDAEVRLEQSGNRSSKANVGLVPLLNFQARYEFTPDWLFRFDLDGLAAPQGRAIDAALFIERSFSPLHLFAGYRTVEGGADNETVYNFAWFHQAVVGGRYSF